MTTTREELYAARDAARARGDKALAREIDLEIANRGYQETTVQDQPAPVSAPSPLEEAPAPPETSTREAPKQAVPPKPKKRTAKQQD